MNKKEIAEIKKQFTPERTTIDRVCGCVIDSEKQKKLKFAQTFLTLPEEEVFKYCDIFKKVLSGSSGKNLIEMSFPLEAENPGGGQDFLMRLRTSGLKDDDLIDEFYDKVLENYFYPENYLIMLAHAVYDIPGKATDGFDMNMSDDVFEYIIFCVCPVNLSKPGLCYYPDKNSIQDRIRDWIIDPPMNGLLFPAFNDRTADIHELLYYSKSAEELNEDFIREVLCCQKPLTAAEQKDTFLSVIEQTLGEECDYEMAVNIHENIGSLLEAKEESAPPVITKKDMQIILENSGASDECMGNFEDIYRNIVGKDTDFMAKNVASTDRLHIESEGITVSVPGDKSGFVKTGLVDGKQCLLITVDDSLTVNGMTVRTLRHGGEDG